MNAVRPPQEVGHQASQPEGCTRLTSPSIKAPKSASIAMWTVLEVRDVRVCDRHQPSEEGPATASIDFDVFVMRYVTPHDAVAALQQALGCAARHTERQVEHRAERTHGLTGLDAAPTVPPCRAHRYLYSDSMLSNEASIREEQECIAFDIRFM